MPRFRELLEERVMELQEILAANDEPEPLVRAFRGLTGIASTNGYEAISHDCEECATVCVDAIEEGRSLEWKEYAWLNEVVERAIERIQLPPEAP